MLFHLKSLNLKQQSWHFGQKILFQHAYETKFTPNFVRLLSNQSADTSSDSTHKQRLIENDAINQKSKRNWIKPIVMSGVALLISFLAYKYSTSTDRRINPFQYIRGASVRAAIPGANEIISSNRKRFNFFADIVEAAAPALVYIEIKDKRHSDYYSGEPVTASNGSGFIIEQNGLILTNAHVVINKPHTFVQVQLQDGRKFIGHVETVDPKSDLATVRIECKNLPILKLGKSADLRAGEWVLALGSPLTLNNTVTAGVVSSPHRASRELGLQGNYSMIIESYSNNGEPYCSFFTFQEKTSITFKPMLRLHLATLAGHLSIWMAM